MAIERGISGPGLEVARVHPVHPGVFRQAGDVGGHVRPGFTAVAGELDVAVVGPDPDEVLILGRLADGEDRGVHFRGRVVDRHAAGLFLLLLLRVVRGQVGRDAIPGLAVVAGAEEELRADVDRPFLVRRSDQRSVPVEAQLLLVVRFRLNDPGLEGMAINAPDQAALVFGVDVIRIARIGEGVETVAVEDVFPLRVGDPAGIFRGTDPGTVILQAAVDADKDRRRPRSRDRTAR